MDEKFLNEYKEKRAIYNEFTDGTSKDLILKINEYRENMRNFSLALGAIVAASLASLGLPIEKLDNFIIFGSCLLLILAFLCFVHLFADNRKETRGILDFRDSLKPLEQVVTASQKLILGKISYDEYAETEKAYQAHRKEVMDHEPDLTKTTDSNNVEIWILLGVSIGFTLVAIGFLAPIFYPPIIEILS